MELGEPPGPFGHLINASDAAVTLANMFWRPCPSVLVFLLLQTSTERLVLSAFLSAATLTTKTHILPERAMISEEKQTCLLNRHTA